MTTFKIAFSEMSFQGKIPPGDPVWREFNGSFSNEEVSTLELANFVYMGHPFTTWHKNNWRTTENYILGQHIGLDFDTEDERSSLPYLLCDKFVSRYASLIYTTPSHAPDKPRARVVFTLDTPIHQATNYTLAASSLLWLFGSADPKAKDAVRFFYGSANCEVEFIDHVLPLDVVKDLITRYRETGTQAKRQHDRPAGDGDIDKTVDTIIAKASNGSRNNLGFWLACTLVEEGLSRFEVEQHMRRYQQAVATLGGSEYSEQEAMQSIASAYRKVA